MFSVFSSVLYSHIVIIDTVYTKYTAIKMFIARFSENQLLFVS